MADLEGESEWNKVDGTFNERVRPTTVFSIATASGGEAGAFDSGRGANAKGSGWKRCLVSRKVSVSRVAPAAAESGKVPGRRRRSMVV